MRRLSTVRRDLEYAAADLEVLAALHNDDKAAAQLRSAAGTLAQLIAKLPEK